MTIIEIIFNHQFILAIVLHGLLILIGLPFLEHIKLKLEQPFMMSLWGSVTIPLYRAFLIGLFVFISYPIIFGITEAPSISNLISAEEGRINSVINVLFLMSLFFPLIPVIGKQIELILPLQVIACCIMVFSWLVQTTEVTEYSYWPGFATVFLIILLAVFTHWLANHLASALGQEFDKKFNVDGCQEIIGRAVILFMQAPAILLYSAALGKQISG